LNEKLNNKDYTIIIDYLLNDKGLGYGKLPKGLLKFHQYDIKSRVALEEHLVEAANYGSSMNGKAFVHFTVSPEHVKKFSELVEFVKSKYEEEFEVTYDISFSVQKSSTDMIAVEMNNEPFREKDRSLLFRPGGHGALIVNLHDLDGDLIFIKNIDNVVPDRIKETTTVYKKAIGGLLLKHQAQAFEYLRKMEQAGGSELIADCVSFAKSELNINIPDGFNTLSPEDQKSFLFHHLNHIK